MRYCHDNFHWIIFRDSPSNAIARRARCSSRSSRSLVVHKNEVGVCRKGQDEICTKDKWGGGRRRIKRRKGGGENARAERVERREKENYTCS